MLGDNLAFSAAITRAGRELDRHPPGGAMPLPGWLRHVTCADVMAAEAAGCLDLSESKGRRNAPDMRKVQEFSPKASGAPPRATMARPSAGPTMRSA